ncbi:hypothetical protein HDA43_000534 [Streptosporangium sandarakinum]|uniref:Uncharacterized protein n=1 Tax=Streptosporangium sandarakinum TaxID=1260955 RepID=A0A852UXP7_9ACTN|nr:hypothetical protein [Streptosporangium sandarakinum]
MSTDRWERRMYCFCNSGRWCCATTTYYACYDHGC